MAKVLVVFSGGQDSTTCLLQAIADHGAENVIALSFFYGQKHEYELEVAKEIAGLLDVQHEILDAALLGAVTGGAMFKGGGAIEQGDKYPNTFVDGRNMLFLLLAAIYAKGKGIRDIVCGVCQTDFSGYPDCRDVFIKSLNVTLNLAMDYEFNLLTPLMWLTKKQVWELADRLGKLDFVKTYSHSCYNNVPGGCQECPACLLRIRGYDEYMAQMVLSDKGKGSV